MRFGGPVFVDARDPERWALEHRRLGYSVAYVPCDHGEAVAVACAEAAGRLGIVMAEVGAWSNPLAADETQRCKALELCTARLALADRVGAKCCVNIAGSRGEQWDGPDPRNLDEETFEMIVQSVREIIDAVRPTRTFYTLETMPWALPDSVESYERLLRAIDRKGFAVHMDVVNLVNCPARAYRSGDLIRDCFRKLGPQIRSCHAKDVKLAGKLTVHLDECLPGEGVLDYMAHLQEMERVDPEMPLMLEHLSSAELYDRAAANVRKLAETANVKIV